MVGVLLHVAKQSKLATTTFQLISKQVQVLQPAPHLPPRWVHSGQSGLQLAQKEIQTPELMIICFVFHIFHIPQGKHIEQQILSCLQPSCCFFRRGRLDRPTLHLWFRSAPKITTRLMVQAINSYQVHPCALIVATNYKSTNVYS